jgi:hypothetical protein
MSRILVACMLVAAACGSNDPKLKVTGLDPDHGDADGGQYVKIYGNRFTVDGTRGVKVYFGSHKATFIRFAGDSELIVEAPGGKPNDTVDVLIIFEPGGELRIAKAFTFMEKAAPAIETAPKK